MMTEEAKPSLDRRTEDKRIQKLLDQAEESHRTHIRTRKMVDDILRISGEQGRLSLKVEEICVTVVQIRDLLIAFRVILSVAKWVGIIAAAIAAIIAAGKAFMLGLK